MEGEERQFLMTTAWLFMRHGQSRRALCVFEALFEDDPRDGTAAVALAELLIDGGKAARAIEVLHSTYVPGDLLHASAVLETRALRMLGRKREADERWSRYVESRKGASRRWMA